MTPAKRRRRQKQPHWPIETLRVIAAGADGLLLRKTSAIDFFNTPYEAYEAARCAIEDLTVGQFCETEQLAVDLADVYGIELDGRGWYLKVTVDDDVEDRIVIVISLHPLKWPLQTNKGTVKP